MRHSSHLHLHFHTHHRAARYDVDMTKGGITKHLINFALPLMVGNLFQQLYNMVDTWVVGNYVSNEAFSAVVLRFQALHQRCERRFQALVHDHRLLKLRRLMKVLGVVVL